MKSEPKYVIRVQEKEDLTKTNRLGELEEILKNDDRAKLELTVEPISAVIALIYDKDLADELEKKGYELMPQRNLSIVQKQNYAGSSREP